MNTVQAEYCDINTTTASSVPVPIIDRCLAWFFLLAGILMLIVGIIGPIFYDPSLAVFFMGGIIMLMGWVLMARVARYGDLSKPK